MKKYLRKVGFVWEFPEHSKNFLSNKNVIYFSKGVEIVCNLCYNTPEHEDTAGFGNAARNLVFYYLEGADICEETNP